MKGKDRKGGGAEVKGRGGVLFIVDIEVCNHSANSGQVHPGVCRGQGEEEPGQQNSTLNFESVKLDDLLKSVCSSFSEKFTFQSVV